MSPQKMKTKMIMNIESKLVTKHLRNIIDVSSVNSSIRFILGSLDRQRRYKKLETLSPSALIYLKHFLELLYHISCQDKYHRSMASKH